MIRSVMESGFHRFGMCVSTDHTGSFAQVGCFAHFAPSRAVAQLMLLC